MKGPLVSVGEWAEVPEVPDRDDHEDSTDLQPDLGSQGGSHQVEEGTKKKNRKIEGRKIMV